MKSELLEPLRHAPSPSWIGAPAGHRIPVRLFGARGRHPVVVLHGLQSHSGWFVPSATHVASWDSPSTHSTAAARG